MLDFTPIITFLVSLHQYLLSFLQVSQFRVSEDILYMIVSCLELFNVLTLFELV